VGQTQAATVSEIEETRGRLDAELEELETYLTPATDRVRRTAMILGGVMAAVSFIAFIRRQRAKSEAIRRLRQIDHRLERLEDRLQG
jgi:hypothetical protein